MTETVNGAACSMSELPSGPQLPCTSPSKKGSPSPGRAKVEHRKFNLGTDQVILTGKLGCTVLSEAIDYLNSEFTKLCKDVDDCRAVGDSKRPQHRTVLVGSKKIIVTGKKTSDLVHQVYDLLVAHFTIKESSKPPPEVTIKVEPIVKQGSPAKKKKPGVDKATRMRNAFLERDLSMISGPPNDYLKDDVREDNVFTSQSDHVIQTKPVSEVVTPVSKRYTPYKLRSHSSPTADLVSPASLNKRRHNSPGLNKSLFSKAITDIQSQMRGCTAQSPRSASKSVSSSVSRNLYSRSIIESVSAHELLRPIDFLNNSTEDKGDNTQHGHDVTVDLENVKNKVYERADVEGEDVVRTLCRQDCAVSPKSEDGSHDASQNSLMDDRLAEILGLKPAKALPAPRLLPPSRFTFPLAVSTTEPPSAATAVPSVDKAINTDQIGGDTAVYSSLGDLQIDTGSEVMITSETVQEDNKLQEVTVVSAEERKTYVRELLLKFSSSDLAHKYPEEAISSPNVEILLKKVEKYFDSSVHRLPNAGFAVMINHNHTQNSGRRNYSENNQHQQRQYQRGNRSHSTPTSDPRSWGDSSHGNRPAHKDTSHQVNGNAHHKSYHQSESKILEPISETGVYCSDLDEVFSNDPKITPGVAFTKRPHESHDDSYVKDLLDYYEPAKN